MADIGGAKLVRTTSASAIRGRTSSATVLEYLMSSYVLPEGKGSLGIGQYLVSNATIL